MFGHLVFVLLVGTTCLELEDCMLWDQSPAAADANVVDRWRGPRFDIIVSSVTTLACRNIIVFSPHLLLEITIRFESHEAFKTCKLIRDNALV
jgi:hypothetical protein